MSIDHSRRCPILMPSAPSDFIQTSSSQKAAIRPVGITQQGSMVV